MTRTLKQLIAGGLACLIMLTSSGCATVSEKHLTPEMVQSGSCNATNYKSPNGKAVACGDLIEPGGIKGDNNTTNNYYPAPQWYESGWFWLGVVAVAGLGVAAVLYAEGGATTATTTVLIAK